jgi:hypothetical protein
MWSIWPQGWFFGPICTIHFISEYTNSVSNWFTGKNW